MPFVIVAENPKTEHNIGGLMRSAYAFGASMVITIGRRYQPQSSDTPKAWRHIPVMNFKTWEEYAEHTVSKWEHIAIEITDNAIELPKMYHPKQAVYLLGREDGSLSARALSMCSKIAKIPTSICLNLATAGSIVMYDRIVKRGR